MNKKHYLPLNLSDFAVISSNKATNIEIVRHDLQTMLDEMLIREHDYLNSDDYDKVVDQFLFEGHLFKGPTNALGRVHGVMPHEPFSFQNANMTSMFQALVMNKMAGYIESAGLFYIINTTIVETPSDVVEQWKKSFPHLKCPSIHVIKAHLHRHQHKGHIAPSKPTAYPSLPIYSADTHVAPKITINADNTFDFSIKLPSSGLTTLRFRFPNSDRFSQNVERITRPVIQERLGKIVFYFTVEKKTPQTRLNPHSLGVDLGKVEPFVATVVKTDGTFSSPYFACKKINKLITRIDSLYQLIDKLRAKADLNERCHRYTKVDVLDREIIRIRAKISRLKHEVAVQTAVQLTDIADAHHADIVFEDLRWTNTVGSHLSGKWNHADIQTTTEYAAQRKGIKTKKVNAKKTSQQCSRCGKTVRHIKRSTICNACHNRLNRDVNASRNIAAKSLNIKDLLSFKQSNSVHMRVSYVKFPASWKNADLTPEKVTLFQGNQLILNNLSIKSVT